LKNFKKKQKEKNEKRKEIQPKKSQKSRMGGF